jgi:hypothetical protein
MARSAPAHHWQPPAAGGTYEIGKDGALTLVQQTAAAGGTDTTEPEIDATPDPEADPAGQV